MRKRPQTLKPCPFCGGNAAVMYVQADDGGKTIAVVCQKCHIGIFRARSNEWGGFYISDEAEAVTAWNARAKTDETEAGAE